MLAGETPVLEHNANNCTRVIGHHPDYKKVAEKEGGQYFEIPSGPRGRITDAQEMEANRKFLDRGIRNGDAFKLETPFDEIRPGSAYEWEVNYLLGRGYKFNDAGDTLIP
ncbi:hypothetical protein [Streptomyces sp. NBC_01092]|uniref:hypothetical protein n=1 Tax=Streptomyces sp. NBC_01092 TaxID=2903748 RepID=UPI00386AC018|nr:hypothetical protein OG254_19325 [Streptomyces sp. NBC_01092]